MKLTVPAFIEYKCKGCEKTFYISAANYKAYGDVGECKECGGTARRVTRLRKPQKEFLLHGHLEAGSDDTNDASNAVKAFLELRKAEIMDHARGKVPTEGRGFVRVIIADSGPHELTYVNQFALRQLVASGSPEQDELVKRLVDVYEPECEAVVQVGYNGQFARFVLSYSDITEDGFLTEDEIGERQRTILNMSEAELKILAKQLTQRASYYGLNLVASGEFFNLVDQESGENFEDNMTLFQVEESLDGLTTLEDTQDASWRRTRFTAVKKSKDVNAERAP